MPIYEYKCLDCGTQLEKLQKSTDEPLTVCEKCSGKLEKQWSLSGFQFKGEGWYVTDYAKDKKGKTADKADSNESGEKKSESKSTDDAKTASNDTSKKQEGSKKETVKQKD